MDHENIVDDLVIQLANNRLDIDYVKADIERINTEISRSELGHQMKLRHDELKALNEIEGRNRTLLDTAALRYSDAMGIKQVHDAVTVNEKNVYDYDPAVMFEYALDHSLAPLLQLNKTTAKALAKTGTLDFVEHIIEEKVSVKVDLSEWAVMP